MSIKGGYKLIDLENKAITVDDSTGITVPGVYDAIEGNYRKPVILTGVVLGSSEEADKYVDFTLSGTDFVGILGIDGDGKIMTITVGDDDKIVVTVPADPEADPGVSA